MVCPRCGTENDDDWPLEIELQIMDGGCQECWEKACDASWWEMVQIIGGMQYDKGEKV